MDQPERISRLRTWWQSAQSTYKVLTWEGRCWILVGLAGAIYRPLSESIPVIFFMSAYALAKGSRVEAQEAKREMLEEEASEP